jgi:hypothetical protein
VRYRRHVVGADLTTQWETVEFQPATLQPVESQHPER